MATDRGTGADALSVAKYPGPLLPEHAQWRGLWTLEKFAAPVEWYLARLLGTSEQMIERAGGYLAFPATVREQANAAMRADLAPYDVAQFENTLLNAGITALWNILSGNTSAANTGASPAGANAVYNNAQARLGIGDSSTAASASQTDLQAATNKWFQAMDATYPSVSAQTITLRITVAGGNANFAWNEWVIDNCNGSNSTSTTRSGGTSLNRAVSAQGTKTAGQTWVPTATVTLS